MAVYTYDGCCGSCMYMNTNDYTRTKDHCYCTYRRQYYDLTERKCRYYEYDPHKDYYDLNHRWHIVSAIFKRLGISDIGYDCINVLENFRVNVLEKDEKYAGVLREYDLVGPAIADFLMHDENCIEICKTICSSSLVNILELIKQGKNDEALRDYLNLVELLKEYYKDNLNEYMEAKKIKNK